MAEPINDTAKRLNEVQSWLRRFVYFDTPEAYDVTSLWVLHTWCRDSNGAYVFDYTPRIAFIAENPGSGKTEALSRVCDVIFNGKVMNSPTAVAVANRISQKQVSPCIDEIDELFGRTSASKSELRSVLNVGYQYNGVLSRHDDDRPCFGPLAFAGMSHNWLTNPVLRATRSRTISTMMTRKPDHVTLDVFRRHHDEPKARSLSAGLAQWGKRHVFDLLDSEPELPNGVDNRDRDLWFPLLSIAELAGDDWAERGRAAVRAYVTNEPAGDVLSDTDRLIVDMHPCFLVGNDDGWLPTRVMIERLFASRKGPVWRSYFGISSDAEVDQGVLLSVAKAIAGMFADYGVESVKHRFSEASGYGNVRAYRWADLAAHVDQDHVPDVPVQGLHDDDSDLYL